MKNYWLDKKKDDFIARYEAYLALNSYIRTQFADVKKQVIAIIDSAIKEKK